MLGKPATSAEFAEENRSPFRARPQEARGRMFIEKAKEGDWPELERIYRETRLAVFSWVPAERIVAATLARDAEGEVVYVARDATGPGPEEGWVLGFVSVWAPDNFVHHLYLDLALRGRGAGTALLEFVAKNHPGALRLKCVERNAAAREFYLRRGWRVVGGGLSDDGDYLLMERAGGVEAEAVDGGAPAPGGRAVGKVEPRR